VFGKVSKTQEWLKCERYVQHNKATDRQIDILESY